MHTVFNHVYIQQHGPITRNAVEGRRVKNISFHACTKLQETKTADVTRSSILREIFRRWMLLLVWSDLDCENVTVNGNLSGDCMRARSSVDAKMPGDK